MIDIEVYSETEVLITSDFPMRDRELLKSLPGSRYDLRRHIWTAPLTWATCQAMRGMFGENLSVGPRLVEWSIKHWNEKVQPALVMRNAWDDPNLTETFPDLYPFQRGGVSFLTKARSALLMDEMGTGKTPQTIRTLWNLLLQNVNPFPAIVVAPNNMIITWQKEFEKFFPGVKVAVVKGTAQQRRKILDDKSFHVFVINFEGVRSHSKLASYGSIRLRKCYLCDKTAMNDKDHQPARCEVHPKELNKIDFRTIIVDEAHRMKDPTSKQSRAIKALRKGSVEQVYALTGTAIGDTPVDMWPVLNLIDPKQFPSRQSYIDRYCLTSYNIFGGLEVVGLNPITKDEFFRVVDPITRRMPKAAVLPFLPEKVYSTRYVEMHPKQAKAYKQMDENQIAVLGSDYAGVTVAANPLTELTRLTQFASAYAEIDPETGNVLLSAPSNKVDALLDILQDDDLPAVVFAQSRQLIMLAAKALDTHKISYSLIVGGQTPDEREDAKEKFQQGKVRCILCTISAGGIGITLTRSNRAIFMQRSWSMIENKQAEDRVHRIGSQIHEHIDIIDIVSVDTVEVNQRIALQGKEERLQEVMRDADTVARVKAEHAEYDGHEAF